MEKITFKAGSVILEIVRGDITKQDTEAVVNAANKQLAPGGGVAGAIHRAAGPELWEECKKLGGCETGEAKLTGGYRLASRYVIHTVGPVYNNRPEDAEDLKRCYFNSLALAAQKGIRSIAFPAISTGIFGYPVEEAAEISLRTAMEFMQENALPAIIRFVLFGESDFNIFHKTLKAILQQK